MKREFDTIAAIATAVSNAGIGIVRMSGEDALPILGKIFEPYNKKLTSDTLESHHIYYGNIIDPEKEMVVDECLVIIMKGPNSYTREDVVEINCHGGMIIVKTILELVLHHGARPAEPGEFTKRAFLNGRIDLSQAEAVMELIDAKNELARKNSMSQLKGDLSGRIRSLREAVIYEIAYIESALDDPEHISLDGYPDQLREKVVDWIGQVKKMIATYDNGRLISDGIRTCIVGKPNAGKSSFLNALLGEDRAIVTDIAGTTRDTLEETITLEGITLRIVDTAGIRSTEDVVEKIGVERARREMEQADLILCILDTSSALTVEDQEILEQLCGRQSMVILNKSDLEPQFTMEEVTSYVGKEAPIIALSAKYHRGMDSFLDALKNMMFHGKIDTNDEIYITSSRHKKALDDAWESLRCVKGSIDDGMPEDFFTIDLMDSYEQLGTIIGESVEEDLVNEIFSKFCTGK